jgi:hypothetical protein
MRSAATWRWDYESPASYDSAVAVPRPSIGFPAPPRDSPNSTAIVVAQMAERVPDLPPGVDPGPYIAGPLRSPSPVALTF